jgi:hypothetical protein
VPLDSRAHAACGRQRLARPLLGLRDAPDGDDRGSRRLLGQSLCPDARVDMLLGECVL